MAEAKKTAQKAAPAQTDNGQAGMLDIDPNTFTVGEMEDFEETAGTSFMHVFSKLENDDYSVMTAKVLKALVWVAKRRHDPEFTVEQAAAVPLSEVSLGGEGDADPSS